MRVLFKYRVDNFLPSSLIITLLLSLSLCVSVCVSASAFSACSFMLLQPARHSAAPLTRSNAAAAAASFPNDEGNESGYGLPPNRSLTMEVTESWSKQGTRIGKQAFNNMNHCVPEWDAAAGTIDVSMHYTESFLSKWDSIPERKYNFLGKADARDQDLGELRWDNGKLIAVTTGQDGSRHKQQNWISNSSSDLSTISDVEGAVPFTSLQDEKINPVDAVAGDLGNIADRYMQEDQMISWLHYPLDEPFERYCSELLTDTHNSKNLESGTAAASEQSAIDTCREKFQSLSKGVNAETNTVNDLVPSPEKHAVNNMHRSLQPAAMSKQENSSFSIDCSNDSSMLPTTSIVNMLLPGPGQTMSGQMPPQPAAANTHSSSPLRKTTFNFSHFSRPVAAIKERLQTLGMSTGLTEIERLKNLDRAVAEACTQNDSPGQVFVTGSNLKSTTRDRGALLAVAGKSQWLDTTSVQPAEILPCRENADLKLHVDSVTNIKMYDNPSCSNNCATSRAVLEAEGIEKFEVYEPSLTASSGGSGYSVDRIDKVAGILEKRRSRDADDLECQSRGPEEEEHGDGKKPSLSRSTSTKRSRTAEIHNQSERRRRDRINEKLRALQELIPNSSKTDKASLLEEAIEYLKMLQTQLQMLSFRNGMSMSPMLIPPGIQYLQMAQMPTLPRMHMAMGMGIGTGMLDTGAAATSRHVLPVPSFPGLPIPGYAIPTVPASAMGPLPGPAVATHPGPTVPTAVFPVPTLPISGFPGLPVLAPSQYTVVPSMRMGATDQHDPWMLNDIDHKVYHAGQQVSVHPQPANMKFVQHLMPKQHLSESQENCKTASTSP